MNDQEKLFTEGSLFESLIDLTPQEREIYLIQNQFAPGLVEKVLELLHADEEPDDFLGDNFSFESLKSGIENFNESINLDNYSIVKLIQYNEQSLVFEGIQKLPVERRVAIKVVNPTAPKAITDQFRFEQQRVAGLCHPYIVQYFGIENDGHGLPCIIMELIEGDDIKEYCVKYHLRVDERLNIFMKVCEAINHAHSLGIIHCDIKPSNILIRESTLDATPAVIDFGVSVSKTNMSSLDKESRGTLNYVSPEQVSGMERVTIKSDVYSLGKVLHELIFDIEASDATSNSKNMNKPLGKLEKSELKAVIAKATSAYPENRYQNAIELKADIQNILSNKPISVKSELFGYRSKLFFNRNKISCQLALISIIVLFSGAIQLKNQEKSLFDAELEKTKFEKQANVSDMSAASLERFLSDILVEGRTLTKNTKEENDNLANMMEAGAKAFTQNSSVDNDAKYTVLNHLTRMFLAAAEEERARVINDQVMGSFDTLNPSTQIQALINQAWIAANTNQFEIFASSSEKAYQIALDNDVALLLKVEALSYLGQVQLHAPDLERASVLFEQALDKYRLSPVGDDALLARLHYLLAYTYTRSGQISKARDSFRKRVKTIYLMYGEKHDRYLHAKSDLEFLNIIMGVGKQESLESIKNSYNLKKQSDGTDSTTTLQIYGKYALSAFLMGDLTRAYDLYQGVMADVVRVRGQISVDFFAHSISAIQVYMQMAKLDQANKLRSEALAVLDRIPSLKHSAYAKEALKKAVFNER